MRGARSTGRFRRCFRTSPGGSVRRTRRSRRRWCCSGLSAAFGGPWVERRGPRAAATAAAVLLRHRPASSAASAWRCASPLLVFLGMGVIGGIGCGLGYISPVSTLVKWFPDRRGMATGMAIMGFGGGAFLAGYLNVFFMDRIGVREHGDRARRDLSVRHADRVASAPAPAGGLEAGGLDRAGQDGGDDRRPQRDAQRGDANAAVLPAVGHPVHQRDRRHRHPRAGVADDAGHVSTARRSRRRRSCRSSASSTPAADSCGRRLRTTSAAATPTRSSSSRSSCCSC